MSTRFVLIACTALLLANCGDDDGATPDAGPGMLDAGGLDAAASGPCTVDSSTAVRVQGFVVDLATMCAPSFTVDYQVCWLGHADHCSTTTSLGRYDLTGLPNAEVVLRMEKTGEVPRLLPLTPLGCTYDAQIFASPTRPVFDSLVGGAGYDPSKAYIVTLIESGVPAGMTRTSACVGPPGVVMTASRGTITYLDATGTTLGPGTATTAAGVALVTLDMAPALGETPEVVRITGTRTDTSVACHLVDGHGWTRGDPTSETEFVQDAPVLAGHITYGWWVHCDAM